jgi:hypothetical protein
LVVNTVLATPLPFVFTRFCDNVPTVVVNAT